MAKITLEITEKELKYYKEYCKIFETDVKTDLTMYLQARALETETYLKK